MDLAKLQEELAKVIQENQNKQYDPLRIPRAPWGHQFSALSDKLVGRYPTNIVKKKEIVEVKKREKKERKIFISGGVSKLLS